MFEKIFNNPHCVIVNIPEMILTRPDIESFIFDVFISELWKSGIEAQYLYLDDLTRDLYDYCLFYSLKKINSNRGIRSRCLDRKKMLFETRYLDPDGCSHIDISYIRIFVVSQRQNYDFSRHESIISKLVSQI